MMYLQLNFLYKLFPRCSYSKASFVLGKEFYCLTCSMWLGWHIWLMEISPLNTDQPQLSQSINKPKSDNNNNDINNNNEKNDRRNSGGILRQKFNLIDVWHLISDIWHLTYDIWQWTNGPMDKWTSDLMDQWANEPMEQWTNGPMDQWTNGPMDL